MMDPSNGTPSFSKIKQPGVVEMIVDRFERGLLAGEIRAGQRLPSEAELAHQLGVGRGAVREAMKMLAALGVVEIQQGDGTYVASQPTPTLLSPLIFSLILDGSAGTNLLELRYLVQAGYCQLAARKATDADWDQMEAANAAWETYARTPDPDVSELARLDLAFHFAILDATHNDLVIRLGRVVEELFFASIRSTLSDRMGLDWGIGGHRQILAGMRTGDPELIYRAVVASLAFWERRWKTQQEHKTHGNAHLTFDSQNPSR